MTDIGELYTKFLDIEENLDLFSLKIQGISFWERVRLEIFSKLVRFDSGLVIPQDTRKRSKLRYYISAMIDLMKNPLLSSSKKVLFVGSPRRILRKDGFWWDIYTDPIINALREQSLSLEYAYLFNHFKPPRTLNLKYLDFIEMIGHLRQTLRLSTVNLEPKERKLLQRVRSEVQASFGVDIDIEHRVHLMLKKRKSRVPLYQLLLKRIKPRIVILAVSYGKEDFIEACKSLKIPVAELQHGLINQFHVAYSFKGDIRRKLTFPDYLLSFGEFWKEGVEYPIDDSKIIIVGYPLIDEQRERYKALKKKKQIVFISQTTAGERISKFALELSKIENLPYNIVYKLQPQECDLWKTLYPWLIDANLEVIDKKTDILHKILAESEIQIGVSSTALYEGLAFGLRTYLIDYTGVEYFQSLLESEIVSKIDTVENFLKVVNSNQASTSIDVDFFFKKGAARAIADFAERMAK
jgi:hypothetical protein